MGLVGDIMIFSFDKAVFLSFFSTLPTIVVTTIGLLSIFVKFKFQVINREIRIWLNKLNVLAQNEGPFDSKKNSEETSMSFNQLMPNNRLEIIDEVGELLKKKKDIKSLLMGSLWISPILVLLSLNCLALANFYQVLPRTKVTLIFYSFFLTILFFGFCGRTLYVSFLKHRVDIFENIYEKIKSGNYS